MEPERRIEKWLRAFAKKRREQAGEPLQLRPAARERLQREIARQSEENSRAGWLASFLSGLRLKLAFAVCFIALAVGGWFLFLTPTGQRPTRLSMNRDTQPEIAPIGAAHETPPAPVMSPPVAAADKKVTEEKSQGIPVAPTPTPPSVALSANRAMPPGDLPRERDRTQITGAQKQITVASAAPSAPATDVSSTFKNEAADSVTATSALSKDAATGRDFFVSTKTTTNWAATLNLDDSAQTGRTEVALQRQLAIPAATNTALFDLAKATGSVTIPTTSQQFNRLGTASTRRTVAGTLKTAAPVLTSFRVEQSGNNLKVLDADGSVYTGSVQIAQQEPPGSFAFSAANNAPTESKKATPPAPQNYFFRVAGTNRALNENIVFSGNFVPLTNNQFTKGIRGFGGLGGGGGASAAAAPAAVQSIDAVLSNSRIDGNVVIGDQKPENVIATPAH